MSYGGAHRHDNGSGHREARGRYGVTNDAIRASRDEQGRSGERRGRMDVGGRMNVENGHYGAFSCDVALEDGRQCAWRSQSAVSLQLHRADRHLLFPAGGEEEIRRIDPLLEEERREQARRARKRGPDDEAEDKANGLIPGLNIQLNTPELIAKWLAERKRRWPTASVVRQKQLQSWDEPQASRRPRNIPLKGPLIEKRVKEEERDDESSDSDSSDADVADVVGKSNAQAAEKNDQSESDDENSDVDEVRDAISSKVPPKEVFVKSEDQRPLCRFFQRGSCRNGATCSHRHELDAIKAQQNPQQLYKKRKRPRAASPNPFEAPHLLRALLQNEIAQHVNYVAQVVRFLVRNDYLLHMERQVGDADEQRQKRSLVVEVDSAKQRPIADREDKIQAPLIAGAAPIAGTGLYTPQSPTLKPITSLALPPAPDEFALMDPLRAHDAKPMTHEQYRQIALDGGVRMLLEDDSQSLGNAGGSKGQHDQRSKAMIRALSTLDALPSLAHRSSALEQILGVSAQSALHSHQLGPTFVRSDRQPSASTVGGGSASMGSGGRLISEQELFRLGLRVGVEEIRRIRMLASRVSAVLGGPTFDATADEVSKGEQIQPWWDAETRQAMRVRQWHQEGEWRDKMRKLGVEIE